MYAGTGVAMCLVGVSQKLRSQTMLMTHWSNFQDRSRGKFEDHKGVHGPHDVLLHHGGHGYSTINYATWTKLLEQAKGAA